MRIKIENVNGKLKLKIKIQNSKLIPSLKISCAARVKEIGPNIYELRNTRESRGTSIEANVNNTCQACGL